MILETQGKESKIIQKKRVVDPLVKKYTTLPIGKLSFKFSFRKYPECTFAQIKFL